MSVSFSRWSKFPGEKIWTFWHGRTRMTLSFPTVLSAPPSESEKCPFNNVNVNGSHLTAHSFGVESQARGKGAFTVGVVAVEVGTYPGGSGYAVGLTRR